MKYLKLYENLTNYKVEVLTSEEFNKLYFKIYPRQTNLKDKIHYFDWHFDNVFGDKKHRDSIRLITAYNKKDILGICFITWWSSGDHYAVSYLSTNKDYFQMGISKRILDVLFKYFSETYPDDIMYWSGYSIDGWKYLHPKILELSKKYNVKTKEKAIEYPTKWDKNTGEFVTKWDDESHELFDKSREEIEKIYGSYESFLSGQYAPLYRSVSFTNASWNMKKNIMYQTMQLKNTFVKNGISLTRNKNLRYKDQSDDPNEVQFTFDTNKLKNNYKLVPFDYWKGKYGKFNRQRYFTTRDEDEEIVIGNIKNLKKYIIEIEINSRLITYYKNPSPLAYAGGVYENFVESLKNFIKDTNIKVIGYGDNFVEIDSKKIKWNNTEININLL